ncbi:DEAD/DEAH box helicase [Fusobacterium necrophorum]|uniref:DEAD/DEAH box helicase n=1 Tax=Fusobacterium necrophorum TaxID=859 RepID=UPI0011C344C4|nr:DEAD/DEAH box helicase family protein [Fusobacterium necrophorum]
MKIIRDTHMYLVPENAYEQSKIENILMKECIYPNPKYLQNKKRKFTYFSKEPKFIITYDTERFIHTDEEGKKKSLKKFKLNKGNYFIYTKIQEMFPVKIIDQRVSYEIQIESTASPRDDEQKRAIDAIDSFHFNYGVLESGTGTGKTFMATQLMCNFKEKTLVLVDMNLLIEQFIDSILKFTNIQEEEIGIIRGEEINYQNKKIIIATMQTLSRKIDIMKELAEEIGFIVQDECQIASCETIQEILKHFKPRYMLGLSGTPYRDDHMDFLIREAIGPIIYTSNKKFMIEQGSIIVPILRPIFLKCDRLYQQHIEGETELEFRGVVEKYYNDPNTIKKISQFILKFYDTDSQLIICKEKKLVDTYFYTLLEMKYPELKSQAGYYKNKKIKELEREILKRQGRDSKRSQDEIKRFQNKINILKNTPWYNIEEMKKNPKFHSIYRFTGNLKKPERDALAEKIENGEIKILLVTTTADKAVSFDRLSICHLLFSTRERNNTIQRVGRCCRNHKMKNKAIIFDYIYDHYMAFYQFFNKKENCRLNAFKQSTKIHPSIVEFCNLMSDRYKYQRYDKKAWKKLEKLYVIEVV